MEHRELQKSKRASSVRRGDNLIEWFQRRKLTGQSHKVIMRSEMELFDKAIVPFIDKEGLIREKERGEDVRQDAFSSFNIRFWIDFYLAKAMFVRSMKDNR